MQWRQTRFDPGMERDDGRVRPHGRARSPPLHHIPFGSISQCVTRIGWIGDDLHEWGGQPCSTNQPTKRGTSRHGHAVDLYLTWLGIEGIERWRLWEGDRGF